MPHRVFVAINLPQAIREKLYQARDQYPDLPCRWTKKENLHVTLSFLGYVGDEEVLRICEICREIAQRHEPFYLEIKKLVYGPPGKPARLVWALGEPSLKLGRLQGELENAFFDKANPRENNGAFTSHVTLARIKEWEWRKMEPEEKPVLDQEISLKFEILSIEIMESQLKKEGPEYAVLESLPLGKT